MKNLLMLLFIIVVVGACKENSSPVATGSDKSNDGKKGSQPQEDGSQKKKLDVKIDDVVWRYQVNIDDAKIEIRGKHSCSANPNGAFTGKLADDEFEVVCNYSLQVGVNASSEKTLGQSYKLNALYSKSKNTITHYKLITVEPKAERISEKSDFALKQTLAWQEYLEDLSESALRNIQLCQDNDFTRAVSQWPRPFSGNIGMKFNLPLAFPVLDSDIAVEFDFNVGEVVTVNFPSQLTANAIDTNNRLRNQLSIREEVATHFDAKKHFFGKPGVTLLKGNWPTVKQNLFKEPFTVPDYNSFGSLCRRFTYQFINKLAPDYDYHAPQFKLEAGRYNNKLDYKVSKAFITNHWNEIEALMSPSDQLESFDLDSYFESDQSIKNVEKPFIIEPWEKL